MARSNIPKFGNWEGENDVPYTVYFDKARKNRGEKVTNPYDLQQNLDVNHDIAPAAAPRRQPVTKPEEFNGRRPIRPSSEHTMYRENIQYRQFSNPQPRSANVPSELSYGHHGQRPTGFERFAGAGDDQGFERAPRHLQQQVKEVRATQSPPIWEDMEFRNAPVAPAAARPRQRNVPPRNESPDRVAAVPMFGDWNENDPTSADNFTGRFNRVRQERYTPPPPAPNVPRHQHHSPHVQQQVKVKTCCFPW